MVAYIVVKLNVRINNYDIKSYVDTFNDHLLNIVNNYLL